MNTTRRPLRSTERRRSRRYLPPKDFRLALKRPGLLSLLSGDLLHSCINLSEGGLRALLKKDVAVGDTLRARLEPGRGAEPLELILRVQYAVPSGTQAGCWEAGLLFENPSAQLKSKLRSLLLGRATPMDRTTRRLRKHDSWGRAV